MKTDPGSATRVHASRETGKLSPRRPITLPPDRESAKPPGLDVSYIALELRVFDRILQAAAITLLAPAVSTSCEACDAG